MSTYNFATSPYPTRWSEFTIPANETTITVTHGASYTPDQVILFPKDDYAWLSKAKVSSITSTTFIVTCDSQAGDAAFAFVAGKN